MPNRGARRPFALLLLLAGCGAARTPAARDSPTAPSRPEVSVECARAQRVEASANAAASVGSLLRARRLGEQAEALCVTAARAGQQARAALAAAAGTPSELLALASAARASGELERARKAESAAVALLERQQAERLSLVQRWSADAPHALETSQHVITTLDGQLLVLDTTSGKLHARLPQPKASGTAAPAEVMLNASGDRLLLRSVDLYAARKPAPACLSSLDLFDARSGRWLKRECASDWAFSPDGSHLAVARIVGWGDGAIMRVLLLDSKTLETKLEVPEPGNVIALGFAPDGVTLVVEWSNRVSLTDLRTGKTEEWLAAEQESVSRVVFGGALAAWRLGGVVSLRSFADGQLIRVPLGTCDDDRYGHVALSPSGRRLATECADLVTVWDLPAGPRAAPKRALRVRPPASAKVMGFEWLPGDRGLVFELSVNSSGGTTVFDTKLERFVPLAGPEERLTAVDRASRFVIVEPTGFLGGRVLQLDATLTPKPVALPDCNADALISIDAASALVTCVGREQPSAVFVEAKSLATRAFTGGGCKPVVHGSVLVFGCRSSLELRDANTGALLPTTPISPSPMAYDGWWDGDSFVASVSLEDRDVRRIVHFGATLQSATEARPADGPCSEHRGKIAWSPGAPYSICDRRTGRVAGEIPPAAVALGFGVPRLSHDGKLVVSNDEAPRLARVDDARAIALTDSPSNMAFVGPELLVGLGEGSEWGLWSGATGRRLATWNETPREVPVAADAGLGVAIEPGHALTLRDFNTGKKLASIDAPQRGDVELSPHGLLSVVESSRVSFWQVSGARHLGNLLNHPKTGEVAFLTPSHGFEVSGDPAQWREVLRCQVGISELPLEVCVDALLEPGVGARSLLEHDGSRAGRGD